MHSNLWKALPGSATIALTGHFIEIRLNHDPKKYPYELYDPDGRLIQASASLSYLQQLGEIIAEERSRFNYVGSDDASS